MLRKGGKHIISEVNRIISDGSKDAIMNVFIANL